MHLILLSYGNSEIVLLPEKVCHYDKALDLCYTGNPVIDMQLNSSSNFTFDKTLYRSKFVDYCIITNNRVEKI
ncbi:hypothetical protein [Ehrlichia muris]|uniref:Uncharacterized protein n=1 Tax=Ehrlichia muris AS145 TaxID=1423892 RepID=V9R7C9_9RICK|nr:hypothetical protein [Ehrlichia muris]AHC39722.1 hypothetical protein EMUR_02545 [Ehrlichia muris AS145]